MLTWHAVICALADMGIKSEDFQYFFDVARITAYNWRQKPTRAGIKTSHANLSNGLRNCYIELKKAGSVTDYPDFIDKLTENMTVEKEDKEQLWAIYRKRGEEDPEKGFEDFRNWLATMARESVRKAKQRKLPKPSEPPKLPETPSEQPLRYDAMSLLRPVTAVGLDFVLAVDDTKCVKQVQQAQGAQQSGENGGGNRCAVLAWDDIVAVAACGCGSVGLCSDGTCRMTGDAFIGDGSLFRWRDITALAAGNTHVLGLTREGKVLAFGEKDNARHGKSKGEDAEDFPNKYQVGDWTDIIQIAAGRSHSVGLKKDGTVVAVGEYRQGQLQIELCKGVKQIAAAGDHSLALCENGTVRCWGDLHDDPRKLKGATMIATGEHHAVGLTADGSVLYMGDDSPGLRQVERWRDIIALSAGFDTTVGVRRDGRVLVAQMEIAKPLDTRSWRLFEVEESVKETVARSEFLCKLSAVRKQAEALRPYLCSDSDKGKQSAASDFTEAYDRLLDLASEIMEMYDAYPEQPAINRLSGQFTDVFLTFDTSVKRKDSRYEAAPQSEEALTAFLDAVSRLENEDGTAFSGSASAEQDAEENHSRFGELLQRFSLSNLFKRKPR